VKAADIREADAQGCSPFARVAKRVVERTMKLRIAAGLCMRRATLIAVRAIDKYASPRIDSL